MKKELMIKTLQDIKKANIKLTNDDNIIFGSEISSIDFEYRYFHCYGSEKWYDRIIRYSEVKSVEVFE